MLLQERHGSALLLGTFHLNIHEFLPGGRNVIHDGLEVGSFGGVIPVGSFTGGIGGIASEFGVGLEHGFIIGGFGNAGGSAVGLECFFAKEGELAEVEDLEWGIECRFEFFEFFVVGCSGSGIISCVWNVLGEFF